MYNDCSTLHGQNHERCCLKRRTFFTVHSRGEYRPCESCDFTRLNCLIYIKSGNIIKKSGENQENCQQNREKSELSHGPYWHCPCTPHLASKSWKIDFFERGLALKRLSKGFPQFWKCLRLSCDVDYSRLRCWRKTYI